MTVTSEKKSPATSALGKLFHKFIAERDDGGDRRYRRDRTRTSATVTVTRDAAYVGTDNVLASAGACAPQHLTFEKSRVGASGLARLLRKFITERATYDAAYRSRSSAVSKVKP